MKTTKFCHFVPVHFTVNIKYLHKMNKNKDITDFVVCPTPSRNQKLYTCPNSYFKMDTRTRMKRNDSILLEVNRSSELGL